LEYGLASCSVAGVNTKSRAARLSVRYFNNNIYDKEANIMNTLDILRKKMKDVNLNKLSIGDLACLAVLDLLRQQPGQVAVTVEGRCTVIKVDDALPPPGWECRCFANGDISSCSFKGPDFPHWVAGGDGGIKNGEARHAVVHPTSGQVYFVVVKCS
jgi:hypothetical protein